jgi:hypothetical protein
VGVWFGFLHDAAQPATIRRLLTQMVSFLEEPTARDEAITYGDPATLYLALCAIAFDNAYAALEAVRPLTTDSDPLRRIVAYHFLRQLQLKETQPLFRQGLADEDLRVVAIAMAGAARDGEKDEALFTALEALYTRFPTIAKTFDPVIWDWYSITIEKSQVAMALLHALGTLAPTRMIPYWKDLPTYSRSDLIGKLSKAKEWDSTTRHTILAALSDRSDSVRKSALRALKEVRLAPDEREQVEGLLTRKSAELRQGLLYLLLNQEDGIVLETAQRLLVHKQEPVRLAGLELLRQLQNNERATGEIPSIVQAFRTGRDTLTSAEGTLVETLTESDQPVATLEDALGLCDHSQRTPPTPPNIKRKWFGLAEEKPLLQSEAATALLESLNALIVTHANTPVILNGYYGDKEYLLGNMNNLFPNPHWNRKFDINKVTLPLWEVWEAWWQNRPPTTRDKDGLEVIRAYAALWGNFYGRTVQNPDDWQEKLRSRLVSRVPTLHYPHIVNAIMQWWIRMYPPENIVDLLLDGVEYTLAHLPPDVFSDPIAKQAYGTSDKRENGRVMVWLQLSDLWWRHFPEMWNREQLTRLWGLVRYLDEPFPNTVRFRPPFEMVLTLYANGDATDADLYDHLLGVRGVRESFSDLRNATTRKALNDHAIHRPRLYTLLQNMTTRIVEVESQRGDLPTAATAPAKMLSSVEGMEAVLKLLKSLGNTSVTRQWQSGDSKAGTFSHLLRVSLPAPDDQPAAFAERVRNANISDDRLMELALAAPQWATFVETTLQWEGFAEAVWWILAHTKDNHWGVEREIQELWAAQVSERTALTATELREGAVDVHWFQQVCATLGESRWKKVYAAAKYASSGTGHARAQLYADAMLGNVTEETLSQRALVKRHQDSIRALGLLPLPEDTAPFDAVLARYKTVQEFRRGSKKFGSQRQANEKLAAGIALDNLARTAGYADPIRLQWAMEAYDAADLSDGPLTATVGEVIVSLAVNDFGEAEISVTKNGKALKNIPPAVKKDTAVVALLKRKSEVTQQLSRMRLSLEQAMVRGDTFSGTELAELGQHPLLAALLEELIFIGDGIIGYPVNGGRGLQDTTGAIHPIGANEQLRLAHPYDLLRRGDWHEWQKDCFLAERSQPFKQVFRELYLLTQNEMGEGHTSRRYEGHQVQPRKAMALLGSRGWVIHPYDGTFKTFHSEKITVRLGALGYTGSPADIEGTTLEGVYFTPKGDYKVIPLTEIPPRLFSEVMRDLDLVVSVAHVGGVDPEASAGTVEMRAALIRETTALLGIDNVKLTQSHALIQGHLNHYSIHLGSGVVHRQPGGSVCIVPVHSQHRGRLFLPFADDDPKSAEVISKVLLLARDKEIKDPTILQQLL